MQIVTYQLVTDFAGKVLLHDFDPEYFGDFAETKKGREQMEQATQAQLDTGKADTATRTGAFNTVQPFAQSLVATKPGEMSPYAKAQYDSEVGNINDTYDKMKQVGFKSINARGLGNAPTGAESSMMTGADRGRAMDLTGAYQRGLGKTFDEGTQGMNYYGGLQSIYNPNASFSGASDSAFKRSQMGSTFGDIMTGIGTAGSIAAGFAGIPGGKKS